MALVDQWRELESGLPEGWGDARLRLTLADDGAAGRAAALLAPLNPWRTGRELRFFAVRRGAGARPESIAGALRRLDREGIGGTLELVASDRAPAAPETARPTLAEAWRAVQATLPPDWSDLYLRLELDSSDYLQRAALDLAPLNPRREPGSPALSFRCARRFGYGAAPQMVARCLERCDADRLRGQLHVLRVLCDTFAVSTQGPVWFVGGRTT